MRYFMPAIRSKRSITNKINRIKIQVKTANKNSQQRIDVYLTEQFPDFSRARIQKLLDKGEVTVNEKVVKANHRLSVLH